MVDIARPRTVKRKKKIRRIMYGVVGLLAIVLHLGRRVAAEASGPRRRSRDRLDRHRQARPDDPPGPRLRHARARRTSAGSPPRPAGRVEKRAAPPRRAGHADSVILEMSNPDLQQAVTDAQLGVQVGAGGATRTARPTSRASSSRRKRRLPTLESQLTAGDARPWPRTKSSTKTKLISELAAQAVPRTRPRT